MAAPKKYKQGKYQRRYRLKHGIKRAGSCHMTQTEYDYINGMRRRLGLTWKELFWRGIGELRSEWLSGLVVDYDEKVKE